MRVMTSLAIIGALALSIIMLSRATAKDEQERPRCGECGMFSDASSTRVQAELEVKGKAANREFCCVGCLEAVLHEGAAGMQLKQFNILDYNTFGKKTPKMIDGFKAFYRYDTKPLRGSMLPSVAAFASKQDATAAEAKLGGDLLEGWEAVRSRLARERADKAGG